MDEIPVWGRSVWWTRTGWLVGAAVIAIGIVMSSQLGSHLGSCGLPGSLTRPGLAIELARDWNEVLMITGPCEVLYAEPHQAGSSRRERPFLLPGQGRGAVVAAVAGPGLHRRLFAAVRLSGAGQYSLWRYPVCTSEYPMEKSCTTAEPRLGCAGWLRCGCSGADSGVL